MFQHGGHLTKDLYGNVPGVGGGRAYILNDVFTVDYAAGTIYNTLSDPGPGKRVLFKTTTSAHTISAGKFNFIAGVANDHVAFYQSDGSKWARLEGRVFKMELTPASGMTGEYMIRDGASARVSGIHTVTGTMNFKLGTAFVFQPAQINGTSQEIIWILGTTGSKVIWMDGLAYVLMLVDDLSSNSTAYLDFQIPATATSEYVRGFDIGSRITDAALIAIDDTTLANGDTFTVNVAHDLFTGSALHHFTVTAPNPLSGLAELRVQYVDDNNFIGVRINDAGAIILRRIVESTETDNIKTKAGAALAGETILLAVHLYDGLLSCAYRKSGAWTAAFSHDFAAPGFGLTGLKIALTDYTASSLQVWPVRSTLFTAVNSALPSIRRFLAMGDSKTLGSTKWQPTLITNLQTATGQKWAEWPYQIALNGYSAVEMAIIITDQVALRNDTPEYVLINLGANDVNEGSTEAQYKTAMRTIIGACHDKWSSTPIYLARPVALSDNPPSSPSAASLTLIGWVDDLIAEFDYVYAGPDERDLEGGDSYVTNFADWTHQTAAGYIAVAGLWQTAMGY